MSALTADEAAETKTTKTTEMRPSSPPDPAADAAIAARKKRWSSPPPRYPAARRLLVRSTVLLAELYAKVTPGRGRPR